MPPGRGTARPPKPIAPLSVPDNSNQLRPTYIYTQIHCGGCGKHITDHGSFIPLLGRAGPHIAFAPSYLAPPGMGHGAGRSIPPTTTPQAPRAMRDDPRPVASTSPGHDLVTWYPDVFAAAASGSRPASPSLKLGQRPGGLEKLLRTARVTVVVDDAVPVLLTVEGCRFHSEPEPPPLGGQWRVLESGDWSSSSSVA